MVASSGSILLAQDDDSASEIFFNEPKTEAGFLFSMAETGSGFGVFFAMPFGNLFHTGLILDGYFLRDPKQVEIADPIYGGVYSLNKVNNVYLIDLFLTLKRRIFAEDMDDSVRPFLSAGFGPVVGLNYPEIDILPNQKMVTMGGFFGGGVDITFDVRYFISVRAQYRIIPFSDRLGVTDNHSMFELRFEVGKRF